MSRIYVLVVIPLVVVEIIKNKGEKMTNYISLALSMYNLNKNVPDQGKIVLKEGLDVIKAISSALKDNKLTQAEKNSIVAEIQQFSKASIKMLDTIKIPK